MTDMTTDNQAVEALMQSADAYASSYANVIDSQIARNELRAAIAAALAAERERALEDAALICDKTPPYPFRPSIEAAHAIRALKAKEEGK